MHLSGSKIKIAVSPEIPHDIINDTFEGALIRRMVGVLRTRNGYDLWSNDGVEAVIVNLEELLELASRSDSRLAVAGLPLIEAALSSGWNVSLEEYGEALGMDQLDIADVLQELCRMYPERLTHFEIAWAEITHEAAPQFGRVGGGADFITSDAIESMNAKSWLEEKRKALKASLGYQPGGVWEKVADREAWRALVLPDDWISFVENEPRDFFEVEKIEGSLRGLEYRVNFSRNDTPKYFTSIEEAFATATEMHWKTVRKNESSLLESMGLSAGNWKLWPGNTIDVQCMIPGNESTHIYHHPDCGWVMIEAGDEIASAQDPQSLVAILQERDGFKP
ncbi:hypothetical protein G6L37_34620 [Agrobacterium rubi]|nr:hypothetical protein [Agrobacterium rubi]NTF23702.1 hypothetical protein [Agrobacterium rubi]